MYVVSYDIENDKLRNQIAKTLLGYGKRVQYSVFECNITEKRMRELYQRLSELMTEEENGNIRFYPICKNCEVKIATIGVRDVDSSYAEDGVIII